MASAAFPPCSWWTHAGGRLPILSWGSPQPSSTRFISRTRSRNRSSSCACAGNSSATFVGQHWPRSRLAASPRGRWITLLQRFPELAHDMLLAPAHRELLRDVFQHHDPMSFAIGLGFAVEAADRVFGHQAVAVDAHEAAEKFLLELGQRLFEQEFALG